MQAWRSKQREDTLRFYDKGYEASRNDVFLERLNAEQLVNGALGRGCSADIAFAHGRKDYVDDLAFGVVAPKPDKLGLRIVG